MTQYKLILADDHQVGINGLKQILEQEQVLNILQTVNQLKDILLTLQQTEPDLLILDVNMYGAHTFDIIPEIKKTFLHLKIITFTSYAAPAFRKEAARLGING